MSDNILQAIDSIQSALASLDLADGEGTALETLQSINTNIDAIRLSIDTRSVAEVTAQNTNFSDLITALSALACSPTVNNYITVQGGAGCCSGTGCEPPSDSGTEGGDPPSDDWVDPPGAPAGPGGSGSSVYYDRKCKMANAIHENIVNLITELNNTPLEDLSFPLLSFAITTMVGALLVLTSIPALIAGVATGIGYISTIITTYWSYKDSVDLAQLLLDLDANEQELVCVLHDSTNGNDALAAYLDVLDTYGTSASNIALLQAVVVIDLVNRLYFQKDTGEEAALESYTPALSCNCSCTHQISDADGYTNGSNLIISENKLTIQISTIERPVSGYTSQVAEVVFNTSDQYSQFCGPHVKVTSCTVIAGSLTDHPQYPGLYGYFDDNRSLLPESGGGVLNTDVCMRAFQVLSNTSCTIEFTIDMDNC